MQNINSKSYPTERLQFGRVAILRGSAGGKYPDGNQVLINGTEVLAAFDTPIVSNFIGPEFDATELVILGHAHEDHMAGLHRVPRAKVHVHSQDLAAAQSWEGMLVALGSDFSYREAMHERLVQEFFYAPRPDAVAYEDGAEWDLGGVTVRAFHMPGHTSGHCVLLAEEEGVAFIGDIDLSSFGPYYGDATSNLQAFRRTLALLPDIPAKVWVTSHHRGVYTDRERFLADLNAFAGKLLAREQRLLGLLRASPKTLAELVECRLIYPPGYEALWVVDAERLTIKRHLDELLESGAIAIDDKGKGIHVYRISS